MYSGKGLDSLEIAIYSFLLNFRRFSKIKTAKFIISQQKELKKINKIFFRFAANKNPKKFIFLSRNNHILVKQKRDENLNKKFNN